MKINKSLGSELFNLFGPNGSDQVVFAGSTRRLNALKEIARHGLVKLEPRAHDPSIIDVRRTNAKLARPVAA